MTLQLSIDADTEAHLRKMATDTGKDLNVVATELLAVAASASGTTASQSATEFDAALEELFRGDHHKPAPVSTVRSRDAI